MIGSFSYNYDVAHCLLAQAKELMKVDHELHKAKALVENSIQIFPNYVEAHYCLASIYEKFNDYNNASDEYQKAIIINPFFSKAYFKLAIIQEEYFQDFDFARKCYETTIEIKCNYFDAIYKLAQLLETKYYDYEKAVHFYDAAHKIKANDADITFRLARIYQEHLLDYTLAKKYFIRTIENDPRHSEAHYYLSLVLAKKFTDKEAGRYHYLKACELNKNSINHEQDEYFSIKRDKENFKVKEGFLNTMSVLSFLFKFR